MKLGRRVCKIPFTLVIVVSCTVANRPSSEFTNGANLLRRNRSYVAANASHDVSPPLRSLIVRWEDYTQTAVDPSDDCTIWYVGDYLKKGETNYSSRMGGFRFPGCH